MDDEAALLARRVALAASAWFNAPADVEAYRRLATAVSDWDRYCAPMIDDSESELLDELAEVSPPVALSSLVPDVVGPMMREARRRLGP